MALNEELNTPSELLEESQRQAYYCRGCGGPLPQGRSAHFYAECLKADKRRRIAERRQRETQQFHGLISSSVGNRPNECLFRVWEER